MEIKFYDSPYERMIHKSDHAEALFGHRIDNGELVALGYLYREDDNKWVAHYYEPEVECTFETRDEAANYLVILSTQQADDLLFH